MSGVGKQGEGYRCPSLAIARVALTLVQRDAPRPATQARALAHQQVESSVAPVRSTAFTFVTDSSGVWASVSGTKPSVSLAGSGGRDSSASKLCAA
jgi:superfamily I DNA and RNA helicase